jgi:hypothetical protein
MNKKEIIAKLKRMIENVYPHFDVVVLWADADLSFLNYKKLTNMNSTEKAKPRIEYKPMSFGSAFKYKMRLFQPSQKNIQYLCEAISTEPVNIFINYVEVTFDFVSLQPAEIAKIINTHLVHYRKGPSYHNKIKGTLYWGNRKNNKEYFFPVTYHERISKIAHQPCCHLEYKMLSKLMCEKQGLSVASDLLDYDFVSFFERNTKFFTIPTKCEIGKAHAKSEGATYKSNRGYEKFFEKKSHEKISKLDKPRVSLQDTVQEMLHKLPTLKPILQKEKHKENAKFTAELQDALLYKL